MEKRNFYNQVEFEIRCEWGMAGVEQLAPISDVVIIVDVLSFTSAVEIATQRGARVYPYRGDNAAAYAAEMDALLVTCSRLTRWLISRLSSVLSSQYPMALPSHWVL